MHKLKIWQKYQWLGLGILWMLALTAGLVGFTRYATWNQLPYSLADSFYLTLQLIPMNSGAVTPPLPLELNLARFAVPFLTGLAVVKVLLDLFRQQIDAARLRRLRGHIIICGLSRKGFLLAQQFRKKGARVVVIERDEKNSWIAACHALGLFVLPGDATTSALLLRAGVKRARGLFAVCDNDGLNIEIALSVQAIVRDRRVEPLPCLIHVSDPQLCALLREQEATLEGGPFRLELFNVFERGARRLLQEHPAWRDELVQTGVVPHLLVVGLGRMGESLVLHTARSWWDQRPDKSSRLQVTIIDRYALRKVESLYIRYPQLAQACELIPHQIEIHSPEFESGAYLSPAPGKRGIDHVYICVDNDSLGLHAGLVLLRQRPNSGIPIVIRMAEQSGLARLLGDRKNDRGTYQNLYAFGYLDHTCTPDLLNDTTHDVLARAAHEEYVQQQMKTGTAVPSDPSMQPWAQLDEQYRKANYQWVDHINQVLKEGGYTLVPLIGWDSPALEFSLAELERMAQLEHQLWCQDRQNDGWRYALGPKDLAARTHPHLVDWDALPEAEREKNRTAVRGIPSFLSRAGYQIIPQENGVSGRVP